MTYGFANGKTFAMTWESAARPSSLAKSEVFSKRVPIIISGPTACEHMVSRNTKRRCTASTHCFSGGHILLKESVPRWQLINDTTAPLTDGEVYCDLHGALGSSTVQEWVDVDETRSLWYS